MELPFFFEENLPDSENFKLSEESSRHIVQVLRMKEKDELLITNGKGVTLKASLISANKKKAEVQTLGKSFSNRPSHKISIGISLIKNKNRFEWFLEKAVEIGVSEIIPFESARTENHHFRHDRVKSILVSAMLQSQQVWLPEIYEPVKFKDLLPKKSYENKYIAHCIKDKRSLLNELSGNYNDKGHTIILIGPEGDFTKEEVEEAIQNKFIPVSLGETRLRTETAGLVAAVLLLSK
jgi:16S rRNA (uracil1498-N3)-methyltransferase